jgi:hypothetical protein
MERIAPSAVLEVQIADVLSRGIEDNEQLAELGRLGTRLVLHRAVEDKVTRFLGRARYERTSAAAGSRNGSRSTPIQTAEGEISIAMPQVGGTLERFVSRVIPDQPSALAYRVWGGNAGPPSRSWTLNTPFVAPNPPGYRKLDALPTPPDNAGEFLSVGIMWNLSRAYAVRNSSKLLISEAMRRLP